MSCWNKLTSTAAVAVAGIISVGIAGLVGHRIRKKYLLRREKDEEAARNLELRTSEQRALEKRRREEEKQKEYERRVQLSRTPLTECTEQSHLNTSSNSSNFGNSNHLRGTFWNRVEVMNSVLFPLIRFAMEDEYFKSKIRKVNWMQKDETVPLKTYDSYLMFDDDRRCQNWLNFHSCNLSASTFEVEYQWQSRRFHDFGATHNLKCRAVSLNSTSLRIVFEAEVEFPLGAKLVCWDIPITLIPNNSNGNDNNSNAANIDTFRAAADHSHVELAKFLDSAQVSNKQFEQIFGVHLVTPYKPEKSADKVCSCCSRPRNFVLVTYAGVVCDYCTGLPTVLRQLTFEYAN